MSQRILILTVTVILLLGIGVYGIYRHGQNTPKPTAANAVVITGVSLAFNTPLKADMTFTAKNSTDKTVVTRKLEVGAQRFNLALIPGVYQLEVQQKDQPPATAITVTVSEGQLSQVTLTSPATGEATLGN